MVLLSNFLHKVYSRRNRISIAFVPQNILLTISNCYLYFMSVWNLAVQLTTFHSNQQNPFEHISKILNYALKTHLSALLFIKICSMHLWYSQYLTDPNISHYLISHFINALSSLSFTIVNVEMVSNILLINYLSNVSLWKCSLISCKKIQCNPKLIMHCSISTHLVFTHKGILNKILLMMFFLDLLCLKNIICSFLSHILACFCWWNNLNLNINFLYDALKFHELNSHHQVIMMLIQEH